MNGMVCIVLPVGPSLVVLDLSRVVEVLNCMNLQGQVEIQWHLLREGHPLVVNLYLPLHMQHILLPAVLGLQNVLLIRMLQEVLGMIIPTEEEEGMLIIHHILLIPIILHHHIMKRPLSICPIHC